MYPIPAGIEDSVRSQPVGVRPNQGIKLMGRAATGLPVCLVRGVYVRSRPPRSNLSVSLTGGTVTRTLTQSRTRIHHDRRTTVGVQLRYGGINKAIHQCTIPSNGMHVT